MKTKDRKELITKDIKELKMMLKEARSTLFSLRLDKAQNKLKNTRSIFFKRKEIAQISTAIKEKEFINAKNI